MTFLLGRFHLGSQPRETPLSTYIWKPFLLFGIVEDGKFNSRFREISHVIMVPMFIGRIVLWPQGLAQQITIQKRKIWSTIWKQILLVKKEKSTLIVRLEFRFGNFGRNLKRSSQAGYEYYRYWWPRWAHQSVYFSFGAWSDARHHRWRSLRSAGLIPYR